ncbi:hypothetical protein QBC44DRAFT_367555 [Cladorrhinum sp. PSN332]|nr:hypothetical protein QBC44DRAFT_367555 [Cladorrhinum sp. PSN332]
MGNLVSRPARTLDSVDPPSAQDSNRTAAAILLPPSAYPVSSSGDPVLTPSREAFTNLSPVRIVFPSASPVSSHYAPQPARCCLKAEHAPSDEAAGLSSAACSGSSEGLAPAPVFFSKDPSSRIAPQANNPLTAAVCSVAQAPSLFETPDTAASIIAPVPTTSQANGCALPAQAMPAQPYALITQIDYRKHIWEGLRAVAIDPISPYSPFSLTICADGSFAHGEGRRHGGYGLSFLRRLPLSPEEDGLIIQMAWPMDVALQSQYTEMVAVIGALEIAEHEIRQLLVTPMWFPGSHPRSFRVIIVSDKYLVFKMMKESAPSELETLMGRLAQLARGKRERLTSMRSTMGNIGAFISVEFLWVPGHLILLHNKADEAAMKTSTEMREIYMIQGKQTNNFLPVQNAFDQVRKQFFAEKSGQPLPTATQNSSQQKPRGPEKGGKPLAPLNPTRVKKPRKNKKKVPSNLRAHQYNIRRQNSAPRLELLKQMMETLEEERAEEEDARMAEEQLLLEEAMAYEKYLEGTITFQNYDTV